MNTGTAETAEHSPGQFNTTRWSVVLSCADSGIESVAARDALSELCQTYWRPLFAYVCRRGYSTHDAEDLTQDFFSSLMQGPLLERADPARHAFDLLTPIALESDLYFLDHRRDPVAQRDGRVMHDDLRARRPDRHDADAQRE